MTAPVRERIPTDNEKYGSGLLDEDGGTWIVLHPGGAVAYVATNRVAAEDAVYAKAHAAGVAPAEFTVQVWAAQDTYPGEE